MTYTDSEPHVLPVGTKQGCLTIIGGFEEYDQYLEESAQEEVADLLQKKKSTYKQVPLLPEYVKTARFGFRDIICERILWLRLMKQSHEKNIGNRIVPMNLRIRYGVGAEMDSIWTSSVS